MVARALARSLAALLTIAIATSACSGKPAKTPAKETDFDIDTSPDPPEAPAAAAPAAKKGPVYPAPFTWEEIRAATKSGRTYRYRVEVPGKPPRERVLTFVKVDDSGCEIFAGGENPKRMGWPTLQKHSEFPQDLVTTREETVKLPGGKFDCMVYEVRGNDGEVTTYYFARTLPGAPVLFYTEQDGERLKTTTLLQHIPGKG
jgi:hypothetical protein